MIKNISTKDEPIKVEWENEYFKKMWNIQIDNHVKRYKKIEENVKRRMWCYLSSSIQVSYKIE